MKWIFPPILQPIIILTTILTQCFNASFASIAIDPSSSEHATSKINAVQNIGLRYGNRINADRGQRLDTRLATAQLPYLDIVRKVVIAVLPSVLDALVVQNLSVMIETDTRPLVIID